MFPISVDMRRSLHFSGYVQCYFFFLWIYEEFFTNSKKKSQQLATPTKVSVILEIKKVGMFSHSF